MKTAATIRGRAKAMRKELTFSERRLWKWLRNRSLGGFKIRRQVPIGPFIVDFYCAELKLAIEVDGAHHASPGVAEYHDQRIQWLQRKGIDLVRISNELLERDSATGKFSRSSSGQLHERSDEERAPHPAFGHLLPAAGGEKGDTFYSFAPRFAAK